MIEPATNAKRSISHARIQLPARLTIGAIRLATLPIGGPIHGPTMGMSMRIMTMIANAVYSGAQELVLEHSSVHSNILVGLQVRGVRGRALATRSRRIVIAARALIGHGVSGRIRVYIHVCVGVRVVIIGVCVRISVVRRVIVIVKRGLVVNVGISGRIRVGTRMIMLVWRV